MKLYGLTGGIGMGKSTAEQWLRQRGVPVVDTDVLARKVVEPGQPALQEIQQAFGNTFVGPDGQLRREELARIVFSDPTSRRKLERITHPRIHALWLKQLETWRSEGRPLAVVIIPLLFETGAEKEFGATVCVACSAATQRRRLLSRGWSEEEIKQRISSQWLLDRKMAKADFVVWTEGGLEVMGEQLARIFNLPKSSP
jgi:dephospho-CoA kinase